MEDDKKTTMAVVKKAEVKDDAKELIFESAVEALIPLIQPLITPATKKFTEFMNDGNVVMIRSVKGKVHMFHIKSKNIDKFDLKQGTEAEGIYNVEDFIQMLLSGNFGKL